MFNIFDKRSICYFEHKNGDEVVLPNDYLEINCLREIYKNYITKLNF